uniref:Uncharacterized protein n=1 Tax=Globodera rostochiensis TaxID=31243 RepID=A0A914IBP8_GLORO
MDREYFPQGHFRHFHFRSLTLTDRENITRLHTPRSFCSASKRSEAKPSLAPWALNTNRRRVREGQRTICFAVGRGHSAGGNQLSAHPLRRTFRLLAPAAGERTDGHPAKLCAMDHTIIMGPRPPWPHGINGSRMKGATDGARRHIKSRASPPGACGGRHLAPNSGQRKDGGQMDI